MQKKNNSIDQKVGSRIRLRRMTFHVSQGELSERIGVTFQQVQRYENGKTRVSAGRLQNIALALNVPVSFFFEEVPTATHQPFETRTTDSFQNVPISRELLMLAKSFIAVRDPKIRQEVLGLIETLAATESHESDQVAENPGAPSDSSLIPFGAGQLF